MLEASCPVENCPYRSIGGSVEEVINDVKQHARIKHGLVDVHDKDIMIQTLDPNLTTGCM
jgi:predicted small metal-binding protein